MKTEKKKKKVSFTKKQLNKHKRMQSKIKAKASERKRRKIARGNVNVPRKYKFKYTSKRVSHNGGYNFYIKLPKLKNNFIYILSNSVKVQGEFSIKSMIRLATRLQRRRKRIKFFFKRFTKQIFTRNVKGYKRFVRAYVSYSERALGLRLGRGKSKLGGWRIPLKKNQLVFYSNFFLSHGCSNIVKKTNKKIGGFKPLLVVGSCSQNKSLKYVYW